MPSTSVAVAESDDQLQLAMSPAVITTASADAVGVALAGDDNVDGLPLVSTAAIA
jgi:hypothetical protein